MDDKPRLHTTPHFAHLDGLRACLALFVVIHHSYLTIWPVGFKVGSHSPLQLMKLLTFGRFAVDWFIVLSGFCLAMPTVRRGHMLRHGVIDFYRRRAKRILPTFYLAVAVCTVLALTLLSHVTGTHWDVAIPVTRESILANLLLIQDLWQVDRINHAFWSVAVEWRIYFLFPLILWMWRTIGPAKATFIVFAAFTLLAMPLTSPEGWFTMFGTTFSFIGLFAMGMFAADLASNPSQGIEERPRLRQFIFITAACSTLLAVGLMVPPSLYSSRFRTPISDALFGLGASAWLVLWTSGERSMGSRVLSTQPLPAIGVFAYSLYLTHAPVIQLVWQLAIAPFSLTGVKAMGLMALIAVPTCVALAYLFYLAFERPFLPGRARTLRETEAVVAAEPAAP